MPTIKHETTDPEILSKARELGLEIVEDFLYHSFVETATGKAVSLAFSSINQEAAISNRQNSVIRAVIWGKDPTTMNSYKPGYLEYKTIDGRLIKLTEKTCCNKHSSVWRDKEFVGFVYEDAAPQ